MAAAAALAAGADPALPNHLDDTALMWRAKSSAIQCARLLLANPRSRPEKKSTPTATRRCAPPPPTPMVELLATFLKSSELAPLGGLALRAAQVALERGNGLALVALSLAWPEPPPAAQKTMALLMPGSDLRAVDLDGLGAHGHARANRHGSVLAAPLEARLLAIDLDSAIQASTGPVSPVRARL